MYEWIHVWQHACLFEWMTTCISGHPVFWFQFPIFLGKVYKCFLNGPFLRTEWISMSMKWVGNILSRGGGDVGRVVHSIESDKKIWKFREKVCNIRKIGPRRYYRFLAEFWNYRFFSQKISDLKKNHFVIFWIYRKQKL